MTFRAKLLVAFMLVALIPLAGVGLVVRHELERRATQEFKGRLATEARVVRGAVVRASSRIAGQVAALTRALEDDNRLRRALLNPGGADEGYLIDYAGNGRSLTGLSLLQLLDPDGRILSSGHFRGETGRGAGTVLNLLRRQGDDPTLLRTRTAAGEMTALVRIDSFVVAGRPYWVVGGVELDSVLAHTVASGDSLRLAAAGGSAVKESPGRTVALELEAVADEPGGAATVERAGIVLAVDPAPLGALRRRVDFLVAAGAAITAATVLVVALAVSGLISRPLADLAETTTRVNLTNLDVDFGTDRTDEVGQLADLLQDMVHRLAASRDRLTAAERRATVGDMARQLNHDIKNGLMPIRNVVQHLGEVAGSDPASLASVFAERRSTLDSSIAYLETLARNIANLTPDPVRQPCDLHQVLRDVVRGVGSSEGDCRVHLHLADDSPTVLAEPTAVRRVFHNLLGNALDSLNDGGLVTVRTERLVDRAGTFARTVVSDDGPGMTSEELDRAFTEWYTTKQGGSGLGLTIVRRLVLDLGGRLRVETAPGSGTTVIVDLPVPESSGEQVS